MFANRSLKTSLAGRIQMEVQFVLSVYTVETVERKNGNENQNLSLNFHKNFYKISSPDNCVEMILQKQSFTLFHPQHSQSLLKS